MKTNISGFPEFLPAEQLAFDSIVAQITAVYQSFGYVPLETAAVERIDTLVSKGIDSKEVYALRRLNAQGDDGDKDIALRFDLTVPLARYVAQNYADLVFPFRRYQCQPVWRGERAQKGRYRQFHQFDLDVLTDGKDSLPLHADAEIIAAAHTAIKAILPEGEKFTMRVNSRKILIALLTACGFESDDNISKAIKIIDDLEKLPRDKIEHLLREVNSNANIEALLFTIDTNVIHSSIDYPQGHGKALDTALYEVMWVIKYVKALLKLPEDDTSLELDITIARGLDYYTGTVIETRLEAAPELGSICSGGRYDNLTASLSDRNLPGVGVSIGVSRLAVWLMQQPPYSTMAASTAKVIVTGTNAPQICQTLRAGGIAAELALGDKSPGQHFQTAQKRGLAFGIVADDANLSLRTFADRTQTPLTPENMVDTLKPLLK